MDNESGSIVLGGGCFWCIEAVFELVPGVNQVVSGYSGGHVENPTYEAVCTGETGHAEVVEVFFDSASVNIRRILEFFLSIELVVGSLHENFSDSRAALLFEPRR